MVAFSILELVEVLCARNLPLLAPFRADWIPGRAVNFPPRLVREQHDPSKSLLLASKLKIPEGLEGITGDVADSVAGASICTGFFPGEGPF